MTGSRTPSRALIGLLAVVGALVGAVSAAATTGWSGPKPIAGDVYIWTTDGAFDQLTGRSGLMELPGGGALALAEVGGYDGVPVTLQAFRIADDGITSTQLPTPVESTNAIAATPGLLVDGDGDVTASWATLEGDRAVTQITRLVDGTFAPPQRFALPDSDLRIVNTVANAKTTYLLGGGGRIWTATLAEHGLIGAPVALPHSDGYDDRGLESAEEAQTADGRALVTFHRNGYSWGVVFESSGAMHEPVRLGRGFADPFAGADGSLLVVATNGNDRWLRQLQSAQQAFDDPVPLPNPGGSYAVEGATVGSDGTIYLAELASDGGNGLIVWSRTAGPVAEPRLRLSLQPPLALRRPWSPLLADPAAVGYGLRLFAVKGSDQVALTWDSGEPTSPQLRAALLRPHTVSNVRSLHGLAEPQASVITNTPAHGVEVIWAAADGSLREAEIRTGRTRVISRDAIGGTDLHYVVNARGQATIVFSTKPPSGSEHVGTAVITRP